MKKLSVMKKCIAAILLLGTLMSFAGCDNAGKNAEKNDMGKVITEEIESTATTESTKMKSETKESGSVSNQKKGGELKMLTGDENNARFADQGGLYYIFTNEDGIGTGWPCIRYVDYKACREVYLCNKLNCDHKNHECTAVLPKEIRDGMDEFVLFGDDNYLYLLMEMSYSTGGMGVSGAYEEPNEDNKREETVAPSLPPVIYRMKKDGTEREKIYTFDSGISVGDVVLTDGTYFYFVTLKQKETVNGNITYSSTYDRQFVRLDLEEGTAETVTGLGDRQEIKGCSGRQIVLSERDFGREVTEEFRWTHEDEYEKLYQASKEIYNVYNIDTGKSAIVKEIENAKEHDEIIHKGFLYITRKGEKEIEKINLKTKKSEKIPTKKEFCIDDIPISSKNMEDTFLCWNRGEEDDEQRYLINAKNGDDVKSTLNDRYGNAIMILSQNDEELFVISDCRRDEIHSKDLEDSDDVKEYFYGMISKEDFLNNKPNYKSVKMIYTGPCDLY